MEPLSQDSKDPEKQQQQALESDNNGQFDSKIVDWNGPDDPENPMNWPKSKRMGHVIIISFITLVVNLSSTLFAPAAPLLAIDFGITSSTISTLTVSIFLLGFALGPMVIAPLSELYGRLWIYHACNICFLGFSIGCATSPELGSFLALRFLAGCAGAAPITIGAGTIADVVPVEGRAGAMVLYTLGPLLGPVVGPIIGGFVAQDVGWRWTLWLIAIVSGVSTIVCFIFMRETFGPAVLAKRAARLRKETGDMSIRAAGESTMAPTRLLMQAVVRPTKMLTCSPIVAALSLFVAFVFGLLFLLFTTFPSVFRLQYGFDTSIAGLAYLGIGIGMALGSVVFGVISKMIMGKVMAKQRKDTEAALEGRGGTPTSGEQGGGNEAPPATFQFPPEERLPPMFWFGPLIPAGFFFYGWTAYYQVHWIVPIIATSFIGMGNVFVMMCAQIYLVDAFGPKAAASALAALTVIRCLFGAFLPMAGPPLYDALGLGWGNSLLGFVGLLFVPVPIVFYKYGKYLRTHFAVEL